MGRRRSRCLATLTVALAVPAFAVSTANAAPPAVSDLGFSAVTETSATLEARITPTKRTSYHFEYGTADCASSPCASIPVPDAQHSPQVKGTGNLRLNDPTSTNVNPTEGLFGPDQTIEGAGIPPGATIEAYDPQAKTILLSKLPTTTTAAVALTATGPQPVSVHLTGLAPATTYHFRLTAHNKTEPAETATSADATFTTFRPEQGFAGTCPANETLRYGSGARLPDCRAYEQASPVNKNGGDARGRVNFAKAAEDGNGVSFVATAPLPDGEGAQDVPVYLATRDGSGWSIHDMLPPAGSGAEAFIAGWTPDFSQTFSLASGFDGVGGLSLFSRAYAQGPLETIIPFGGGFQDCGVPSYAGASADGSQVFFESDCKLLGAPAALEEKPNVYVWDRDTQALSLAAVMNDGIAPKNGAFLGPYDWMNDRPDDGGAQAFYYTQDDRAISDDGSFYFTEAKTGQLYLRRNPTAPQSQMAAGHCTEPANACTIHVSATQKTNGLEGPDSAGPRPAAFAEATPDGSKVFFTSPEKLTNDANTGPEPTALPTIARGDIGGSGTPELGFLPKTHAEGLAVSPDGHHLYWADPVDGSIGRAQINGAEKLSDVTADFISGLDNPQGVAVDPEHVYWTDAQGEQEGEGFIGRADLEGHNVEREFISATFEQTIDPPPYEGRDPRAETTLAFNPRAIAVDATHLFWGDIGHPDTESEHTLEHALLRAGLDGKSVEQYGQAKEQASDPNNPYVDLFHYRPSGLAIDQGSILITEQTFFGGAHLWRQSLSDPESHQSVAFSSPPSQFQGVAKLEQSLYWADQSSGQISRSALDGSGKEVSFPDAGASAGLALDSEHLYWAANQRVRPNPGNDLYRFDADSGALTDLTPDSNPNGAQVVGVLGTSEDGSYVYVAANGDLDGPGPATEGDCKGRVAGGVNYKGHCSLYLVHDAGAVTVKFIATLNANGGESDAFDWLAQGGVFQEQKTSRVSADGKTLLFRSQEKLTSYDNNGTPELYVYHPDSGIACVTCNPTGHPPTGPPSLGSIPVTTIFPNELTFVLSRVLSADGNRVFFETTDALVPRDTNAEDGCPLAGSNEGRYRSCLDVYEWEAQGAGSCTQDIQGGGCLYLLSSGTDGDASFLADASASGDDVFFFTRSQLVGQDQDRLFDVYDARAQGGLASQNEAQSVPCEAEACKTGPTTQPATPSAGSHFFVGPGNPKPPKRRKPHHKKHHKSKPHHKGKRHHPKTKHRPVSPDRGARR